MGGISRTSGATRWRRRLSPRLQEILQKLKAGIIPDAAQLKRAMQDRFPGYTVYNWSVAPLNSAETIVRCTLAGLIPGDKGTRRFCFATKRLGQDRPIEFSFHDH
jgi:hypothetical protein